MPDNVTVDNGALTDYTVASDEVAVGGTQSTAQVAFVKLVDGTLNGTDPIPGTSANGLDVDVTRVQGTVTVGDGGSTLSVDDGGGSLTIDGTVSVSGAVDTELTTADLDSGAGTDTRAVVGLVMSASGGGVLATGDGTNGLDVDVTRVSGTVTVGDGGSTLSVDDGAGSLTVDNAALSVTGGGVEASALRVTIASDSTGLVSVDDGGGSLTVDGTVSVSGTVDTELPAAAALADNTANPTVPGVGAFALVFDGTTWDRQPGDSTGGAYAQGPVAHDAAVAGNPLLVGGRASSALPTAVSTDGDAVRAWLTLNGAVVVEPKVTTKRVSVTPTISTTAYTSGDQLGGLQTITGAARFSGLGGILQGITVLDKTQAQRSAMDILFFDRSITLPGDNSAINISDADFANFLGLVSIATTDYNTAWPGTPLNSVATKTNLGFAYVCNATDLFAVAVVRGTPTYVATDDLVFMYTLLQD